MATYPMYPVFSHVPASDYSYYGADQNFMMFMGAEDPIFPPAAGVAEWQASFTKLGIDPMRYYVITEGIGHNYDCRWFRVMMEFVR